MRFRQVLVAATVAVLLFLNSAYAQPHTTAQDIELLKARIADLNPPDRGLPDNEFSLVDERRSLELEVAELRRISQRPTDNARQLEILEKSKQVIAAAIADIAKADCQKLDESRFNGANVIRDQMMQFQRGVLYRGIPLDFDPDPFLLAPWSEEGRLGPSEYCVRWKRFIGDATKQASLITYFDLVKQRINEEAKLQAEAKSLGSTLLDLLLRRKDAAEKKLATLSTKSELSDKLWIVISVIGAFSIGAILAVKLFSDQIQLEWVASGQVIQFVTVMILLSVIMALGLAGILKENTLGTLLGGIAGYVLAQGVGRAAAREVSRSRENAKNGAVR
ncbi:hypothetical protein O4H66_05615 [Comamonadaceae bacterium G21597-S1]|nr:hypothetical protein [Comamonadaceae bacterium G21597-S1]